MPDGTILDTILAHKRNEVAARKARVPVTVLSRQVADMPPPQNFREALLHPAHGTVALIAEVKKASPSSGVIRADFDPKQIASEYAAAGASCLSVLTDTKFFGGSDDDLEKAQRGGGRLPVLRKDFVIDKYQISEARAIGADAVLLITAALTAKQLADFQQWAHGLNMAALVEVHTEAEMETALEVGATLIGINNRDLSTFVTDLSTTERLARRVPEGVLLVAESGIKTADDVRRVRDAGARAVLVGETLMRASDIGRAITELMGGA